MGISVFKRCKKKVESLRKTKKGVRSKKSGKRGFQGGIAVPNAAKR